MSRDLAMELHKQWMGFLQPDGLVVSSTVLVEEQVVVEQTRARLFQQQLLDHLETPPASATDGTLRYPPFVTLAREVFEWPLEFLEGAPGGPPLSEDLVVRLDDLGVELRPTFALRAAKPEDPAKPYLMLVQELPRASLDGSAPDLDRQPAEGHRAKKDAWHATWSERFERMLRDLEIPLGLLVTSRTIRLFYAPRGENSGSIPFPVEVVREVQGRSAAAALDLLLSKPAFFTRPTKARLPGLCAKSRKYQANVSTELAEQVLEALYELVRGFQAADDAAQGRLLSQVLARDPEHVYGGLLRVLMRLVFLLYAEDRDLLPGSSLYLQNYSVHGLFTELARDAGLHPDTMESRYAAWPRLLATFRLLHRGSSHPQLELPAREGYLFDPDAFPFLEGRAAATAEIDAENLPHVSDGCLQRVLSKLLVLDGERLSYRTLDVEQIGSVYEAIMGFRIERATGPSIAIRSPKKHGAPTTIDLEALLAVKPADRGKRLNELTDRKPTAKGAAAIKAADSIESLNEALGSLRNLKATPRIVPKGAMVLQPSDERRRSGSHYTPRELTEPIVRTTLEPVLARLGEHPVPEAILELKICDPAMGSGAFLVEVCRQLGAILEQAWIRTRKSPPTTPEDDLRRLACRTVAQRCLYGVDRNAMAVDLAKLSLWLATLAKDHPFTFLDHALRHGDSLVGLDLAQLKAFHWSPAKQVPFVAAAIEARLDRAIALRREIQTASDLLYKEDALRELLAESEAQTAALNLVGDLVVTAFFAEDKPKAREDRLTLHETLAKSVLSDMATGTHAEPVRLARGEVGSILQKNDLTPFHWAVAFPEVFWRKDSGFDAMVGNPPFLGGRNLTASQGDTYAAYLESSITESSKAADLVARFFRRSFALLRSRGTFGLIATNTIAQGDTRSTGLRWICTHGGEIYAARRRVRWPGEAAVVVSVVHVHRGEWSGARLLDGKPAETISAFLFGRGGHENPKRLAANSGKSFQGSIVLGMGFTFDDTDTKGVASSLAEMKRLIAVNPRNREVIFPYLGGEEINSSPTHAHHRYVINFGERSEEECRRIWPELMAIVEEKVKPERLASAKKSQSTHGLRCGVWWHHYHQALAMYEAIGEQRYVSAVSYVGQHGAFARLPTRQVLAGTLVVVAIDCWGHRATLQSRVHEFWARTFGSSLEDRLRYTPSDCFETFPFPNNFEQAAALEAAGKAYYDFRADLMVRNNEGLTKTYNRFHDPDNRDPEIERLRELHAAMDRAVLDAYGWTDIPTECEFLPDFIEEDEDGNEVPKSFRYRWPDEVRDDVLARLLALNAERHAEEVRAGVAKPDGKKSSAAKKPTGKKSEGGGRRGKVSKSVEAAASSDDEVGLFADPDSEENSA